MWGRGEGYTCIENLASVENLTLLFLHKPHLSEPPLAQKFLALQEQRTNLDSLLRRRIAHPGPERLPLNPCSRAADLPQTSSALAANGVELNLWLDTHLTAPP